MGEESAEGLWAIIDQAVSQSVLRRDPGVGRVFLGVECRAHLDGETSNVGLVEKVGVFVTNQE